MQPAGGGGGTHRPVRVPDPVAADLLVRPLRLRPRRHRAPPPAARGTAPNRNPPPPTCSPSSAASSSRPEFRPSAQATAHTIKSRTTPGPAILPPHNPETRVSLDFRLF